MAHSLGDLPNEVIYQILLYISPTSVPKIQQVSRRLNELAQPLLWRHYCCTQFKYWSPRHGIQGKLNAAAVETDWKKLFVERHNIDCEINRQIDSILATQKGRIAKTEVITAYGYDAKDTLLRQKNCSDAIEDVLARR